MTETSPNSESNTEPFPRRKSQDKAASEEVDYSFQPLQLSYEDGELFDSTNEQEMQEFLRTIERETSELSVSLTEEGKLIREVCVSLTQILKKLDLSIDIPTKGIPVDKNTKKIILNKDGDLQLFNQNDEKQSAPLSEYPPELLIAIIWKIMPELVKIMTTYKNHVGKRMHFFEEVRKELRTIANAMARNRSEKPASTAGQQTEGIAEQKQEYETREKE
jgi:hypothetical protein